MMLVARPSKSWLVLRLYMDLGRRQLFSIACASQKHASQKGLGLCHSLFKNAFWGDLGVTLAREISFLSPSFVSCNKAHLEEQQKKGSEVKAKTVRNREGKQRRLLSGKKRCDEWRERVGENRGQSNLVTFQLHPFSLSFCRPQSFQLSFSASRDNISTGNIQSFFVRSQKVS